MLILLHYVNGINKVMMVMMVTTSYRSSIDIIPLNCLDFEKIALLHFCDRQTYKRTD